MRVRRARRHEWNLSFASMSDIAFLLIIFFAVAGKFTKSTEKEVTLPGVDLGEKVQPRDIELVVTKHGTYELNGVGLELDALKDEISSYLMPEGDRSGRTVSVYADRDAEYKDVAAAIEAVNQADAYLELAVRHAE